MILDISKENIHIYIKNDLEGNMENRNDEIIYGCVSKYVYIYSILFFMTNVMKSGIEMIKWRDERDEKLIER